ncbi:MAG: peptidoglycan-binding protein [Pseudomonadota bacterium]|nr:peptidoglycan-binding protein [Pseudomonadota bacterium]
MTDLAALKNRNEQRWANAKLTRGTEFKAPAQKAVNNQARYKSIEDRTGVSWVFIAVSHYRESSQNFNKSLAQGDPWNKVSVHVPAGRGPFASFEDAAVDALVDCAPHAARNHDWSIGGLLALLERYNGLSYANANRPSPYIWSGTDQYKIGKVVRDHGPIEEIVDKQLGCAGLILAMMALEPTITFAASPVQPGETLDATWLQTSLNTLGATPPLVLDGIIGAATRTALRAFQKSKDGLTANGVANADTVAAIKKALTKAATG